ncbi:hypothetical protein AGR6A_Lc20005 [Agrobacterium sp. NCPPB 925]|nr:hypothetical protein AGR6A_Lc20005 [Agrobacterium sp. NCPPB 925]
MILATLPQRQENVGDRDACEPVWKGEGKSGSQAGAHKLRQHEGRYRQRLAVLIDGDSLSSKIMEGLFGVTAMHGDATIRHIHHDWTQANMRGWKKPACCGVSCRK